MPARKRDRASSTAPGAARAKPQRGVWRDARRIDAGVALGVLLATLLVFNNAVGGAFVYDDTRQIVQNQLIQDPQYFGTALVSDVWAFKGPQDNAWSNYWRPVFTLWSMLNFRLFGALNPTGWHLASILLHAAVALMAYALLVRLGLGRFVAAGAALLFAVHPVHVESVAWISGVPDLLLSLALLASLWFVLAYLARPSRGALAAALLLYALALLAKEIAIVYPALVFVAAWSICAGARDRARRAVRLALPFAGLAVVYFAARIAVLGFFEVKVPWQQGPVGLALNAPPLLAFYLRQALFPLWLGPSYPLRALTAGTLGLENFWLPLAAVALAGAALWWLARGKAERRIGLALCVLLLLPALNINAFLPEQIAHDRYLYLPLLGLLLVLWPALAEFLRARTRWDERRTGLACLGVAALLSVPLGLQTARYNSAWTSALSLWSWGVTVDPGSAFNWTQYGVALYDAGRLDEARQSLDRAFAIMPAADTLLARADVAAAQGRTQDAARDLSTVLSAQPDNLQAIERLALVYQTAGQLPQAAELLSAARARLPESRCRLTTGLAIVLYLSGRKADALAELESVRARVPQEYSTTCREALFRLGQLYQELGRKAEARAAYAQYLALSNTFYDKATLGYRELARQALAP